MSQEAQSNQEPSAIKAAVESQAVTAVEALAAIVAVLNPAFGVAVGVTGVGAIAAWQAKNAAQFNRTLREQLQKFDQQKLDRDFIQTDEFFGLITQINRASLEATSEIKRKALANALLNFCTLPNSRVDGKEIAARLLQQMSAEEIHTLSEIQRLDSSAPNIDTYISGIPVEEISEALGWDAVNTTVSCEGLLQLGLIYDKSGVLVDTIGKHHQMWGITELGRRVIQFSSEPPAS